MAKRLGPLLILGGVGALLLLGRRGRGPSIVVPMPEPDIECDALDPASWPEGFGCFPHNGGFILLPLAKDEPSPEGGFTCERMLYNGYCIEIDDLSGWKSIIVGWWLRIKDADGNQLRIRGADEPVIEERVGPYTRLRFSSEGGALAFAYDTIDKWTVKNV